MLDRQKVIMEQFKDLNIRESLELISNVSAAIAFSRMQSTSDLDYPKDWDTYYALVMNDLKVCGETLANGLARQALTTNMWLATELKKGLS